MGLGQIMVGLSFFLTSNTLELLVVVFHLVYKINLNSVLLMTKYNITLLYYYCIAIFNESRFIPFSFVYVSF